MSTAPLLPAWMMPPEFGVALYAERRGEAPPTACGEGFAAVPTGPGPPGMPESVTCGWLDCPSFREIILPSLRIVWGNSAMSGFDPRGLLRS